MRILLCGAEGQLGNELIRIIESGKAEIRDIPDLFKGAEIVSTDVSILDITDEASVESFVVSQNFDVIINCAAMTNVDGCEEHEDAAYRVNALGPKNLALAAKKAGSKLIQISTDYVFSGNEESDRIENDPTDPQSAYGRTKLAGEELVRETHDKHFIVRTAWLYGYVGANFVKTMLRIAKENGLIKVVNDQFGNPTSANDLAYEILRIAETDNYGTYHCTNNGVCSWFDFASAIVDEAGISCEKNPCATEEFPRPAKRPHYSSLRNSQLEKTIGDEMRPWQDALKEYIHNLPMLER